jgi:hypothetical protein
MVEILRLWLSSLSRRTILAQDDRGSLAGVAFEKWELG